MPEVTCTKCSKSVRIPPNRVPRFRYCSAKCRDDDRRKRIAITCERCGKEVEAAVSWGLRARFCSTKCYWASQNGNDGRFGRDYVRPTTTCAECGLVVQYSPSRPKKYCSLECYWASRRIDDPKSLNSGRKRSIKETVGRCEDCGYDRNIDILVVHHLIGKVASGLPDRDNSRANLVVVCPTCHAERHGGRYSPAALRDD